MNIRSCRQAVSTYPKIYSSFVTPPFLKKQALPFSSLTHVAYKQRTYSTENLFLKSLLAIGILSSIFVNKAESQKSASTRKLTTTSPLASKFSNKTPPTKEQFIKTVREFEFKMKLQDFLVGDISKLSPEKAQMREAFFSNKVIQNYLSRSSMFINFLENRPALITDNAKSSDSDYYECKIYECMSHENFEVLPYRKYATQDLFYQRGTEDLSIFLHIISNENCKVLKKGLDIYNIRQQVNLEELQGKFDQKCESFSFLLSPNAKDTHATSVISILHKETRKHLVSVFINSSQEQQYYEYIRHRFNCDTANNVILYEKEAEKLYSYTKEKLQNKKILIDTESREGFISDPSHSVYPKKEEKELYDALDSKKIDFIHEIWTNKDLNCNIYKRTGGIPVPLLDASHHLQIEKEDLNCCLYSFNFLQGIALMLQDPTISEKVYQLALQVDSGNPSEKEKAKKALITIFQKDLKKYVPIYYDANSDRKSYKEIKEQHLLQRWDMGSLGMDLDSFRKKGYLKPSK